MILAVSAIVGAILLPPAAFDHPPAPPMLVTIREFPLAQIESECLRYGARIEISEGIAACSIRMGDGACIEVLPIIGPGGVSPRDRMLLARHEDGHCNGARGHEGWR